MPERVLERLSNSKFPAEADPAPPGLLAKLDLLRLLGSKLTHCNESIYKLVVAVGRVDLWSNYSHSLYLGNAGSGLPNRRGLRRRTLSSEDVD